MKNFFIISTLLFFSCLSFAEVTHLNRATLDRLAFSDSPKKCTIDNYQDIIFQENKEPPRCHLVNTDLRDADLEGADLRNSNLKGAFMRYAHLAGADFAHADLRGTNMFGAHLRGVNFQGANLQGADLRGTEMQGADLRGAKIIGAVFYGDGFWGYIDRANLDSTIVTQEQAEYLKEQGLWGFVIMEL